MSDIADSTDCPSFEDISAYIDGECDDGCKAHVESCEECQRVVRSLCAVDSTVGRICEAPSGLAQRVLAACRAEDVEVQPRPFWGGNLLRYAAALVLTAGLAIAVRTAVGHSPQPPVARDLEEPTVFVAESSVPAGDTLRPEDVPGMPAVQDRDLLPVTASTKIGRPRTAYATGRRLLAENVAHLWTVPSTDQVEPWLRSQLDEGTWRVVGRRPGAITVRLRASDAKLQNVVQSMYEKGWSLLSSKLPQPNEERRVKFDGRPVVYQADFVNSAAE